MTKETFLRKLINKLQVYFNLKEISEIVNDYNEFFSAGLSDGLSEEELCKTFGNPKTIVNKLKNESRTKKIERFSFRFIIRILFAITLSVYILTFIIHINTNPHMARDSIIGIIIIGIILWFVLGGKPLGELIIYNKKIINGKKIIFLHFILIVLTGLNYMLVLFFLGKGTNLDVYLFDIEIYDIGTFVSKTFYLMLILGLLLLVYSIYHFYSSSIAFYSVVCNILGYIAFILCLLNMQHRLADINDVKSLIARSLLVYFTGIMLSVLAAIYIHQIFRRRDSLWMHKSKREY